MVRITNRLNWVGLNTLDEKFALIDEVIMAECKVGIVSEVPLGTSKVFKVSDKTLAVFNVGGILYAISDICPHGGDSLNRGKLSEHIVKCPEHGWEYDVTNGKCKTQLGVNTESFPVKIQGDKIFVVIRRPRDFDNWKHNYRKNDTPFQ